MQFPATFWGVLAWQLARVDLILWLKLTYSDTIKAHRQGARASHMLMQQSQPARLSMGSKNLSLDASWSRRAVDDIEVALLRAAAFPHLSAADALVHDFVLLDPSTRSQTPAHEDLLERILAVAERMKIGAMAIGHRESGRFGHGGFKRAPAELSGLQDAAFAAEFSHMRERVGWLLTGSRAGKSRHIFVPQFDFALLAILIDLLSQLAPEERPFVHLATNVDETRLANANRFGGLARFGQAIMDLNVHQPKFFVYAWSPRLAQRLSLQLGVGVQPLDQPPELSLIAGGEPNADRLTVGYLSGSGAGSGIEQLAEIVQEANDAAYNGHRLRFIIQLKPPADEAEAAAILAQKAKLTAVAERNVTIIDEFMPRAAYFATLRELDVLLVLRRPHDGDRERLSTTALHAMAAGKLVLSYDDVSLNGTVRSRVMKAPDTRGMGEIINDLSGDIAGVRTAARIARSTYAATLRPSRLFAQLLYGPMILADAKGQQPI